MEGSIRLSKSMAGRLQPPKDQSVDNFWVNQWLVDFNPEKTKALIISNTANIDPVIKSLQI
jgi:hypothetical protein